MGKGTIRSIVLETSDAIWTALSPNYLTQPNISEYLKIADEFNNIWNMPNCLGAIGGRHITLRECPRSLHVHKKYTSNKYSSIILLGISDAKYRFTSVDVGLYGHYKYGGRYYSTIFSLKNIICCFI